MDTHDEKLNVAVNSCVESGCTSTACDQLRLENQELREKLQKLQKTHKESLTGSEKVEVSPTTPGEEEEKHDNTINRMAVQQKKESGVELSQEQVKRLKADYDDVVKRNQDLENRILQMAGEMQLEKARFEETVGSMSEQLMDFVEKMNKLERECMKNKKDCSLVVQLLKCNQSLDRKFVSQKMYTLPSDLKDKLTIELDLEQETEPAISHHPAWSRKLWRTKSTGSHVNTKTESRAKALHPHTLNE